jgi:hypothetical protein
MSAESLKHHVERAARRAQIAQTGVHRLRHTFCSHLAMRGAPAGAIQELAAQDLTTTQRYMHLSPAALDSAIRLRDDSGMPAEFWRDVGDDGSLIRYLQSAVCFKLAGSTGLEPAASGVTGRRSNQLNYDPKTIMNVADLSVQSSDWIVSPTRRLRSAAFSLQTSPPSDIDASNGNWWAVQDSNL